MLRTLSAPFRMALRFPLVQFAFVIAIIILLQSAGDNTVFGSLFSWLDAIVDKTVALAATLLTVKSFTKSWLTFALMVGYVYLAIWLLVSVLSSLFRILTDLAGRYNFLWLRDVIARERGISAYDAWLPFERIRPTHISQAEWEEKFAWLPNNQPPYQPLPRRMLRATVLYLMAIAIVIVMLQTFSPFPVLDWVSSALTR